MRGHHRYAVNGRWQLQPARSQLRPFRPWTRSQRCYAETYDIYLYSAHISPSSLSSSSRWRFASPDLLLSGSRRLADDDAVSRSLELSTWPSGTSDCLLRISRCPPSTYRSRELLRSLLRRRSFGRDREARSLSSLYRDVDDGLLSAAANGEYRRSDFR